MINLLLAFEINFDWLLPIMIILSIQLVICHKMAWYSKWKCTGKRRSQSTCRIECRLQCWPLMRQWMTVMTRARAPTGLSMWQVEMVTAVAWQETMMATRWQSGSDEEIVSLLEESNVGGSDEDEDRMPNSMAVAWKLPESSRCSEWEVAGDFQKQDDIGCQRFSNVVWEAAGGLLTQQ